MKTDRMVILAAGASSRMSSSLGERLGKRMTKCMIPLGSKGVPLLKHLLVNVDKAGFREVVIVTAPGDLSIEKYLKDGFNTVRLSYVIQKKVEGRVKPAGTADAVQQVLAARPSWAGSSFCVCNSDNLYSSYILGKLAETDFGNAMPCYDRSGLEYPEDRTERFAVISLCEDFSVRGIIEKPIDLQISECRWKGAVFISMNLFKLEYDKIVKALNKVPYSHRRNEKELSAAVDIMISSNPGCMHGIPVFEHVPDLTTADDIQIVSGQIAVSI